MSFEAQNLFILIQSDLCNFSFFFSHALAVKNFPHSSVGKESACDAGDPSLIPGSGRSAGEGKGYPLQHSGLENSMGCAVHGVAKSQARLSDFHFHFAVISNIHCLI